MPAAKRASMREGPLSQLFRKTAEDTAASEARVEQAQEPAPVEEPAADRKPHPALESAASEQLDLSPEAPRAPEVPSPQERLRSAFSAEIPAGLDHA